MPKRWNIDHQHQIVNGVAVAPGKWRWFDDDEPVAGLWSDTDPRAGHAAEIVWKRRRDRKTLEATDADEPSADMNPAEPENHEEHA